MQIQHNERFNGRTRQGGERSLSSPGIHSCSRPRTLVARILSCLSLAALAGCSASPSISVLGAYFPDWMFCVLGALLITLTVRAVLGRLHRERLLGPPVVAGSTMLLLFSLLIWLLIFNS
ncbi:MAG TPA: YtcA family lipoprotein [Paraburkholderia sp.]|nr:YtcA family lipoprotein [Paraburkholderia sp.]